MKNFLIVAAVAIGMLTSCNKKANNEAENTEVQTIETTEVQVLTDTTNQVSTDSINQVEQDKVDAAHGHTH